MLILKGYLPNMGMMFKPDIPTLKNPFVKCPDDILRYRLST